MTAETMTVNNIFYQLGYTLSFIVFPLTITLFLLGFYCICRGRIAEKMGDPFMMGLIPYFNDFLLFRRLWPNMALFIIYETCCLGSPYIPFFGATIMIPVQLIMRGMLYHRLAKAFGKNFGFFLGLYILTPLFMAILAFGCNCYTPENDPSYICSNKYNNRFTGENF